jgi:hypothetical protein
MQQSAVDLLAAGKNDTDTAKALGLNRVTVTRWRLYSPVFQAALADQRSAIWGAAGDRLRAMLPKALEILADGLEHGKKSERIDIALDVLKLVGPLPLVPAESTDPEEIVRGIVKRNRERMSASRIDDQNGMIDGLPSFNDDMKATRRRLAQMASPVEANGQPTEDPAA